MGHFFSDRWARLQGLYREYPSQFWLLMAVTLIDRTGGALVFPFLSLYITRKFNVGVTEMGVVFLIFSVASFVSSTIGGALTDRFGRKGVVIFSVVASALSSLGWAFAADIVQFYMVSVVAGLFANVGGPARQAMIADLLPEEQHADGFGILRVVANIAVTIGPMLGGLMAAYSFVLLFMADAITSLFTAVVIGFLLKETYTAVQDGDAPRETVGQSFRGYLTPLRDSPFMAFILVSTLMGIVYIQMYSTLAVFLRDTHGFPEQGFGYIMSMNAAMVVFMQFWITRRIKPYPPLLMMALGAMLYAAGFGMYGLVSAVPLFFAAMAVITIGEMVVLPVTQALIVRFSPEHMRGRYMAAFGLAWEVPAAIGPLMAGMVMDNFDSRLLWAMAAILGTVAALGYLRLYQTTRDAQPVKPALEASGSPTG